MATDKEIRDLKDELRELKGAFGKKPSKENIYSPEAQVPFSEYKGTREEYKEEAKLRKIASGKKDTFTSQTLRFVTAAVFGDEEITKAVRARFQEKYSKEEIEEATKKLEQEFGIKKKIQEDKLITRKIRKILKDELSPINNSIVGLQGAIKSVGDDVKRAERTIKSIDKFLIKTINDFFSAVSGRRGELDNAPDRMKPMTVAGEEGQEYLYYPNAPEGRQLYEKSRAGTAGRIASKEVQKKLDKEIRRLTGGGTPTLSRPSAGSSDADDIVNQIKILLEEESMFRKRDMEKLIEDLKNALTPKDKNSIFGLEADEQEQIMANAMERALDKTLYDALKRVFTDNPELQGGGGGGYFFRRTTPAPPRPTTPPKPPGPTTPAPPGPTTPPKPPGPTTPPKPSGPTTPPKPSGMLDKINLGRGLGRGLLTGAGAVATAALGAVAATGAIFGGIDYGMKEAGNKAIRDISKGSAQDIATAIQVPKYGPYTLQELEKMATEDPILSAKLDEAKAIAGLKPATKPNLTLTAPKPAAGQQIVDQNQKRIEIQSAKTVEIPSQTVNQINNTQVIPVPATQKNIEVHNQENTFNRLLAQEFDHPATYSSMNMG